ncbi:YtxH domain-containing protein [Pontibacter chinhatensis]|uniref:YtxH-like protein n=1 Tax=Pontibacter chinhatensis TaxID=1436961 RepID=A0A1I2RMD9_9BACT|nr:YtxH domain-containing protein [Pontibacter chinhatensis]SFG41835.1 YtxH-like protein [Pontibacter chinhatensis]
MKDNSGKVLLAMLAGASAGVIAGLLMAPDTGEVTRSSIKKWAGKMSKDLEKNLQDGLEEIKKMSSEKFGKSGEGSSAAGDNTGANKSASTGSTATGGTSSSSGSTTSSTGSQTSTGGSSTTGGGSGNTTGTTGGNA